MVTCTLAITHSGLLPSSASKLSAFPRNLSIMSLSCCPQLYIFRGSITRPAFLFRPASDSPHRVCPRTSLLTCWLNFSQVGLSHYAITHWVTTSNFIPPRGNPNDSDLSGHENAIVMRLGSILSHQADEERYDCTDDPTYDHISNLRSPSA